MLPSMPELSGLGHDGRKPWSVSAAWIDYDNNGLLDLIVANHLQWTPENNQVCGPPEHRVSCSPTLYFDERSPLEPAACLDLPSPACCATS
jgi:hypothetical protein